MTSPVRILPTYGRIHTYTTYSIPRVYVPQHLNVVPQRVSVLPGLGHLPNRRLVVSRVAPHHLVTLRVRPSIVNRELLRIENKARAHVGYSATEDYLNSSSTVRWLAQNFDDETRVIRAQTAALLKRVHTPVPRALPQGPLSIAARYEPLFPTRLATDPYISRLFGQTSKVAQDILNLSHYKEPAKRFTGKGHLACLRYSGNKAFSKRKAFYESDDKVRNDVKLLSYYLKNRNAAKGILADLDSTVLLPPHRPSRRFTQPKPLEDPSAELKELKAARLEAFNSKASLPTASEIDAEALRRKKQKQDDAKLAEERAIVEELARKKEQAKRDEANRAAELARQEELAAQAAAERAAEIERRAEEAAKKKAEEEAAAELAKKQQEEKEAAELAAKQEEEARLAEEQRLKEEEEKAQLARLEEIERQAQEEKEEELARQAAELAELARQEAELAELAKQEAELAELARQEAELAELAKQEAELAELAKQEAELAELAKQEAELAAAEAPAEESASEEETPVASPVPTVEEPETPEAAPEDVSQSVEQSENEQTEEEEEEE